MKIRYRIVKDRFYTRTVSPLLSESGWDFCLVRLYEYPNKSQIREEIEWGFPKWDNYGQRNPYHFFCQRSTIPNYFSCTGCGARAPEQYVNIWKVLRKYEINTKDPDENNIIP